MGWTTTYKPKSEPVLDFFVRQGVLRWSDDNPHTYRVLDSAIVHFRTFYAAVEQVDKQTGERQVWAAVILLSHNPGDGHNFGWKDMDESMGPCEAQCPERILKLLTPTEYEYAKDWRARCWANIEKRKARRRLPVGTILKYQDREFVIESPSVAGRLMVLEQKSGQRYTMKRSQLLDSEIVFNPKD